MIVQLALDHLFGDAYDSRGAFGVQTIQLAVDQRGGLLQHAERADDLDRNPFSADGEVDQ